MDVSLAYIINLRKKINIKLFKSEYNYDILWYVNICFDLYNFSIEL